MKIFKYISIALVFGASVLYNSCNVDKLELSNPNQLSPEIYFNTVDQLQASVNAVYGSLQTRGLYNRHIWFGYDNMAHENSGNPQLEADKRNYLDLTFDATHRPIAAFWESCYRGINKANFVINSREIIDEKMPTVSDALKNKFEGEAKFLRGLYYFMLVTRFGDVPLKLGLEDETSERVAAATIWDQIEEDLTFAANNCLSKADEDKGRATSGAAWALLGKARLFQEDYAGALTAFGNVTGYSLEPRFLNNYEEETENGPESIFAVQFSLEAGNGQQWNSDVSDVGLNETCFRGQEYGCFDWFNVFPSMNLRAEFETGDPRYGYSFYSTGDTYNNGESVADIPDWDYEDDDGDSETIVRVGWRKYQNYYKQASESEVMAQASGINMKIIRYADVLLMMAECQANQGNLPQAIALMNQVRNRADVMMPNYPSADYPCGNLAEFMVALEHERKVELCGEQVRLQDLIRWGRWEAFMQELIDDDWLPIMEQKGLVQANISTHWLWPIPQNEIDANEDITQADQNPGY